MYCKYFVLSRLTYLHNILQNVFYGKTKAATLQRQSCRLTMPGFPLHLEQEATLRLADGETLTLLWPKCLPKVWQSVTQMTSEIKT